MPPLASPPLASQNQPADLDEMQLELERENAELRLAIEKERNRFSRLYQHDARSGAKRKLAPMRDLLSEQFEISSHLQAKSTERDRHLTSAIDQLHIEATLEDRRERDASEQLDKLRRLQQTLDERNEEAEREVYQHAQYSMVERRVEAMVADLRLRAAGVQKAKEECGTRLSQWLAVSKEGEVEQGEAEAELAQTRAWYKAERNQRRRMLGERRALVDSLSKFSEDRVRRMEEQRNRIMSRSDLTPDQEKLKGAADGIESKRNRNRFAARQTMSLEERCEEAVHQIQRITGAADLNEVIFTVSSKTSMTEQLKKRAHAADARLEVLKERLQAVLQEKSAVQYGGNHDFEGNDRIFLKRRHVDDAVKKVALRSSALSKVVRLLKFVRFACENIGRNLDPFVGQIRFSQVSSQEPRHSTAAEHGGLTSEGHKEQHEAHLWPLFESLPTTLQELGQRISQIHFHLRPEETHERSSEYSRPGLHRERTGRLFRIHEKEINAQDLRAKEANRESRTSKSQSISGSSSSPAIVAHPNDGLAAPALASERRGTLCGSSTFGGASTYGGASTHGGASNKLAPMRRGRQSVAVKTDFNVRVTPAEVMDVRYFSDGAADEEYVYDDEDAVTAAELKSMSRKITMHGGRPVSRSRRDTLMRRRIHVAAKDDLAPPDAEVRCASRARTPPKPALKKPTATGDESPPKAGTKALRMKAAPLQQNDPTEGDKLARLPNGRKSVSKTPDRRASRKSCSLSIVRQTR